MRKDFIMFRWLLRCHLDQWISNSAFLLADWLHLGARHYLSGLMQLLWRGREVIHHLPLAHWAVFDFQQTWQSALNNLYHWVSELIMHNQGIISQHQSGVSRRETLTHLVERCWSSPDRREAPGRPGWCWGRSSRRRWGGGRPGRWLVRRERGPSLKVWRWELL